MKQVRRLAFWLKDEGQDLAEYCLLTALLALVALGIIYRVSGGISGIWTSANTTLVAGNSGGTAPAGSGSGSASGSQTTASH